MKSAYQINSFSFYATAEISTTSADERKIFVIFVLQYRDIRLFYPDKQDNLKIEK
jgi:hypothetical protein